MTLADTLQNKQKLNFMIAVFVVLFITTNVLIDFSSTWFQNSAFYLSESLLFSSYWLLFLPLLSYLLKAIKEKVSFETKVLTVSLVIAFHLLMYPAVVWVISKTFYTHTFDYWQSFNFGISAYFIKTIIIYGFSFVSFVMVNKGALGPHTGEEVEPENDKKGFLKSMLVTDLYNKKSLIHVEDILYFMANSPYVSIHHSSKKYLCSETLKSLETQLDHNRFVRVHKSCLVNIHQISSIQSRQNGDYDLTLSDHAILRLSRSYAKNFKSKFHQLTKK